uniref:Uncharacterized protein n=1 Tax=Sinocyclocheilus anshuiensis TaxID=1608454 RepID=A0A671Q605_9TELE
LLYAPRAWTLKPQGRRGLQVFCTGPCPSDCEMSSLRVFFCLLSVSVLVASGMYDPDEVLDLPGMSFKPNYRQWSGYLKASSGKFLHYW